MIFEPTYPKASVLSNLHDALKVHAHSKHKLGRAHPKTSCYSYHKGLLSIAHKNISHALWTMLKLSFKMNKHRYRTGTFFNQKHDVCIKSSTSLQCPLCHHSASALQIPSGCQHQTIFGLTSDCHNIAC